MTKSKNNTEGDQGTARSKKPLMLCFAAMFVALCAMVLMAPAKDKEGTAKHYQTLGLKPHSSAAEVKKSYR